MNQQARRDGPDARRAVPDLWKRKPGDSHAGRITATRGGNASGARGASMPAAPIAKGPKPNCAAIGTAGYPSLRETHENPASSWPRDRTGSPRRVRRFTAESTAGAAGTAGTAGARAELRPKSLVLILAGALCPLRELRALGGEASTFVCGFCVRAVSRDPRVA